MVRHALILAIGLIWTGLSFGQEKEYFQQEVDFKIKTRLDDEGHFLVSEANISYKNNSPDTLAELYFHLWPNAYQDNKSAYAKQQIRIRKDRFYFSDDDSYGGIDGFHFLDGKDTLMYKFDTPDRDVCLVRLKKPLKPGDQVNLKIPFTVFLPYTFSRLGHVGQSYQITQWFPKPAVYDKNGWHQMPYLDQGEFYSEFGSFEVSISVPANYVVGATGVLQTESEKAWLKERLKQNFSYRDPAPSYEEYKTLVYTQDNVHDFAWFADKKYNVKMDSVTLESGKKVDVWFYYTSYWASSAPKAMEDLKDAVYCYSKWVGDYPYPSATAVTGALGAGAGMEYPMITVTDPFAIIHEVGHNWFYGILASNERDYGWMDEGFNSFVENQVFKYQQEKRLDMKSVNKSINANNAARSELARSLSLDGLPYRALTSRAFAQPAQYHSDKYYDFNYGVSLYSNPPLFLEYLKSYLGEETFWACMHQYFDDWKFKHPQPEDLQHSFEKVAGQDLSWFFGSLVKGTERVDIGIKSLSELDEKSYLLTLKNAGQVSIPVNVKAYDDNGKVVYETWVSPFETTKDVEIPLHDFKYIKINQVKSNLDLSVNNDFIRRKGIKKIKSVHLGLLNGADSSHRCEEYFMTGLSYNFDDGLMPGLVTYNSSITSKKLEYFGAAFYSFKNSTVRGIAGINRKWNGKEPLRRNNIELSYMNFAGWSKISLNYNHSRVGKLAGYDFVKNLEVKNLIIDEGGFSNRIAHVVGLEMERRDALNKWIVYPKLEYYGSVFAGSPYIQGVLRFNGEVSYSRKYMQKNWAKIRVFGGTQTNTSYIYGYGVSGKNDWNNEFYAADRYLNSGFLSRQTNEGDGGARQFIAGVGVTSILASNVTVDVPKVPLQVFADFGMLRSYSPFGSNLNYYDVGVSIKLVDDFLGIHFPLMGTGFVGQGFVNSGRELQDNMRFTFKWRMRPVEQTIRKRVL